MNTKIINSEQDIHFNKFYDGEIIATLKSEVKGANIKFFFRPTLDFNTEVLKIIFALDAIKRNGAHRIDMYISYMPYARQDRSNNIPACVSIYPILQAILNYADALHILDPHFAQIEAMGNIHSIDIFNLTDIHNDYDTLVSPDTGGVKKIQSILRNNQTMCYMNKMRDAQGHVRTVSQIGDVNGKKCLIIDDILASGSTLINCAKMLKENGAKQIDAFITHNIMHQSNMIDIEQSPIDNVYTTNSIARNNVTYTSNQDETCLHVSHLSHTSKKNTSTNSASNSDTIAHHDIINSGKIKTLNIFECLIDNFNQ